LALATAENGAVGSTPPRENSGNFQAKTGRITVDPSANRVTLTKTQPQAAATDRRVASGIAVYFAQRPKTNREGWYRMNATSKFLARAIALAALSLFLAIGYAAAQNSKTPS